MRKIRYIFPVALSTLMLCGCSDNVGDSPEVINPNETADEITVSASMEVGDMTAVNTRAFSDTPGEGLVVNVFEFVKGTDATNSFLVRKYPATVTSATTAVDNGVEVNFKFTITKTSEPRILQFVVSDSELTVPYGSMAAVMQSLSVENDSPAYWGQLDFPAGYYTRTVNGSDVVYNPIDGFADMFKAIPVVRNFAKISVTENLDNFELSGFELINVPSAGTVAPWNSAQQSVPTLLSQNKTMLPYNDVNAGYQGILSPLARFVNTEAEAMNWTGGNRFTSVEPQYMYEHPYEAGRRTYLLVAGKYGDSQEVTYYKIDLGKEQGEQQIFRNYDILRNYHYAVTITGVARAGYGTIREAVEGTVFNNLSASTETRDMTSLSDGTDLIGVNATKFVVTRAGQELVFKCKYTKDIASSPATDNNLLSFIGLQDGPIISGQPERTVDGDSVVYTITTKAPTDIPQEQTFTVVGRNGLGRTITLLSHTPWVMRNVQTFTGSQNDRPTVTNATDTIVGVNMGAPLTVYFDLPDGMSDAWFPLQFVLESNRQNIENNSEANSTLVVTTGQSLFTGVTDPRVGYVKTVSYDQYRFTSDANNVINVNSPNVNHTIRCRFRTTVALSDLPGTPTSTQTIVNIGNPYFVTGYDYFLRR